MSDKKTSLADLARETSSGSAKIALEFWLGTIFGTEPDGKVPYETVTVMRLSEKTGLEEPSEEVVSGIGTYKPIGGKPRGAKHTVDGMTFVSKLLDDGGYYAHLQGSCGSKDCDAVEEQVRSLADVGRLLHETRSCATCNKKVKFSQDS